MTEASLHDRGGLSPEPGGTGSALPSGERETLRSLAESAAVEGGRAARQRFRGPLQIRLKKDGSEVSDADEAVQAVVVAHLRRARPHDAFLAEEDLPAADPPHPPPSNERICWVIDPIDGTRNFVRGLPLYACSVAAMYRGMPVAGAVYDAERDHLYAAALGGPLLVNGSPSAPVAHRTEHPRPRFLVAIPAKPGGRNQDVAHQLLARFVCRDLGSATLHLAMVATGALDAMYADSTRLWDLAAGYALVTAAGGTLCRLDGSPWFPIDITAYTDQELPAVAVCSGRADEILSLIR